MAIADFLPPVAFDVGNDPQSIAAADAVFHTFCYTAIQLRLDSRERHHLTVLLGTIPYGLDALFPKNRKFEIQSLVSPVVTSEESARTQISPILN